MELRSSTYLHFVQAIKGGSVVKSMNMDTRGKPALKYKEINDIYNLRDTNHHSPVPTIHLRDDVEGSPIKCNLARVESTDSSFMRGILVKSEPEASDFNCNNYGGERKNDVDDITFANMTLKQIKNRCKTKKRKHLNYVGSNKETVQTCSSVKNEFPDFQHKDDECDFEEPLISWKSKLSQNKKSKRKSSRKSVSLSSPNVMSKIKLEQVNSNEDLLQSNQQWPAPIDVKVEVSKPDYSECRTISTVSSASDFSCSEQVDSTVTVSNEDPEGTNIYLLEAEMPYPTEEPQYCSLNEVSFEYMENSEPKFDAGVSSWEIVQVDCPEIISMYSDFSGYKKDDFIIHPLPYDVSSELLSPTKDYTCDVHDSCQSNSAEKEMQWQTSCYSLIQVPDTTLACDLETGVSSHPRECNVSNGVSYESSEDVDATFCDRFSGWEIVKVESPEIISYQCLDLQELGKESYAIYPLAYDVSSESMSPTKDHCTDLHDSFKGNSSEHKMASQTSNYDRIDVSKVHNDNSLQCFENINESSACSFESGMTHHWPSNIRNIAISPSGDSRLHWSSCLNPERHADAGPVSVDSSLAGKQSLSPASIESNYFNASGKPMASAGPQDFHHSKHQNRPERLLSCRKAISPTSQERLCRAMELTGLDESERHQCKGKLYFGKHTNHRILRAQGLDELWRDGVTIKPKSIMRKAKQGKKGSSPRGILKVTPPSRSCTTVQRCTKSAIAFTQQQMRDTESLAMKLATELRSMKDILKGKLHSESEASAATYVRKNADEFKIAIENATKAEESARRLLSMMARDCTRFCKIMRLTEDNTVASDRVIPKERKITFADEAGGKLCHVKVFKDDISTASLPECINEERRLQVE